MGLHMVGGAQPKTALLHPAPTTPRGWCPPVETLRPTGQPPFPPCPQVPEKMACGPGSCLVKDCDAFPRRVTVPLVPGNTHPQHSWR